MVSGWVKEETEKERRKFVGFSETENTTYQNLCTLKVGPRGKCMALKCLH